MIITPIQIRFNDIDLQGHMYNGQYQHLFDLGKNDYFDHVIGVGAMNGERALITASTLTNFLIPVGLHDPIVIHTGVSRLGNKSFTMFQQMVRKDTGAIVANCRTVMVGYNAIERTSFEIPAQWRKKIEEEGIVSE